eukprot:Stramenopile-MAST_4_protein_229
MANMTMPSSSFEKVESAIQTVRAAAFDVDARTAIVTLMTILRKILISHPADTKYRTIPVDNANFHARVGRVKGGIAVLEAVHFELGPDRMLVLQSAAESPPELLRAMQRLDKEAEQLELTASERPVIPPVEEIKAVRAEPISFASSKSSGASVRVKVKTSIEEIRASAFDVDARTAILTLMKIIRNILMSPSFDAKKRSIRQDNAAFYEKVGRVRGGVNLLLVVGFKALGVDSNRLVLSADDEDKEALFEAMVQLDQECNALEIEQKDRPTLPTKGEVEAADSKTRELKVAVSDFNPYSTQIRRNAPQPRSTNDVAQMSETEQKLKVLEARLQELLKKRKVPSTDAERNVIVFAPGNGPSRASLQQLGREMEDNGEVDNVGHGKKKTSSGLSEAQMVMQTIKRRREQRERNEIFRTKAMRDLETLQKMRIYSTVILRLQFSDGWIIQANFSPGERVDDVINFLIRFALVEDAQERAHAGHAYLYTTPPKELLVNESTLADAGLQPTALVYVGWKEESLSGARCLNDEVKSMSEKTNRGVVPAFAMPTADPVHVDLGKAEPKIQPRGKKAGSGKKPKWLKT